MTTKISQIWFPAFLTDLLIIVTASKRRKTINPAWFHLIENSKCFIFIMDFIPFIRLLHSTEYLRIYFVVRRRNLPPSVN